MYITLTNKFRKNLVKIYNEANILGFLDSVKLITVSTSSEAHVLLGKLQAFGFNAMLKADDVGGLESHFQVTRGVSIFVPEREIEGAKRLLNDEEIEDSF